MSNLPNEKKTERNLSREEKDILHVIQPHEKDLGGFCVRRALPNQTVKSVGPWVFFDHMGPVKFPPGEGVNVRPHPHIGIATVTYLFDGEILHRDSIGSHQAIRPGDLNLMVTGSGMVHSEREAPEVKKSTRTVHALQLWLALPKEYEETAPAFYHYSSVDLPSTKISGVTVKVMIGQAFGLTSPVKTFSPTLYAEAKLSKGQTLNLPQAEELAVYIVSGNIRLGSHLTQEHSMVTLNTGTQTLEVTAECDSQIALVGGASLGKRFIDWNFVSSSPDRIDSAIALWEQDKFPKVPGDSDERIPYPKKVGPT